MSQALVRKALEVALKAWADAQTPAVPVAWENVPFSPPATRYARAFILPARTISLTLDRAHRAYSGVFQVSLVMPIGTGPAAAEALIASLDAAFSPAAQLTAGTLKVTITLPMSSAPAIQEPDRFVIPVSCLYEAHTA